MELPGRYFQGWFVMSRITLVTLRRLHFSVLTLCVVLVAVYVSIGFGPLLERKFFPMMVNGTILSAEEYDGKVTRLEFQAEKVRKCGWRTTDWFIGKYGGLSAYVPSVHKSSPQIRDEGIHVWKNLWVALPEDVIRAKSFSITKHRCHPFWLSESLFYNGVEEIELLDIIERSEP